MESELHLNEVRELTAKFGVRRLDGAFSFGDIKQRRQATALQNLSPALIVFEIVIQVKA